MNPSSSDIAAAVRHVQAEFPFEHYMDHATEAATLVGEAIVRHLPAGARLLDFGAGPCDKTAVLQTLGFRCSAYDDLRDFWHQADGSRERILSFAVRQGIEFRLADGSKLPWEEDTFDAILLLDVIEHLHDSPRDLLNELLGLARDDALLVVTTPNLVSVRKRLDVLRGRTNLAPYEQFYWAPGPWRGHVREYTDHDLALLAEYLDLDVLELRGCDQLLWKLRPSLRKLYLCLTSRLPRLKDSWILLARKRTGWTPRKELARDEALATALQATPFARADVELPR